MLQGSSSLKSQNSLNCLFWQPVLFRRCLELCPPFEKLLKQIGSFFYENLFRLRSINALFRHWCMTACPFLVPRSPIHSWLWLSVVYTAFSFGYSKKYLIQRWIGAIEMYIVIKLYKLYYIKLYNYKVWLISFCFLSLLRTSNCACV